MTRWLGTLLLVFGLTAPTWTQSVVEPPEYPDGQFCSPAGDVNGRGQVIAPDHKCACHRHVTRSSDDPACELGEPSHEPVCNQWCHERHCSCPVTCDTEGHDHAAH